ncbi:hypothetical protein DPMN_167829 [Dreissena polymorpha]|uniref:Uncharacterized protein n=1 Tax=Dreissena polymorpha TaxID=45954 RepID=A0A9D4F1J7_DREPO|nr:hypothetical protein DPMN_167829 [Dreissena polymorpha]
MEKSVWKTVTYRRKKQSKNYKKEESKSCSPDRNNSENHNVLIGKYFNDQMQRNKLKQIKISKKPDRKEYMKLYKQKQRECLEYKEKDKHYSLKSKRTARQSEDYRQKDRECNLKSMKTARQSED